MTNRPNILVICGRNKKRSRTAEYIFKNDNRFNIRSAGLSPKSERVVSENDIQWADLVFVMEANQRSKLCNQFENMDLPPIEVLFIADDYEFLDEELIDSLENGINYTLKQIYNI
jgi:predicted protein tyrosine phosphatase